MAVSFELFVEFDSSIPGEEQREQRHLLRLAFPAFDFELVNLHQVIAN
jgi:hypothetical protein